MIHRNVRYRLRETSIGVWRFEYAFGPALIAGELNVASRDVAARIVRQMMRYDLRTKHADKRKRVVADHSGPDI